MVVDMTMGGPSESLGDVRAWVRSEPVAFGDYCKLQLIAKGGMGVVYAARHAVTGARVAVKAVETSRWLDAHARQRFLREARTLAEVRHPNVVRVFETVLDHDPPFLVMELLEGETLQSFLRREGRPSIERAIAWFAPIVSAVAAIHDAGILHRDLKLGNVMLVRDAAGLRPVVLDFGISKLAHEEGDDPTLTHSEALLGTPRYLSPEQMLNAKAASPLSDQYALGVMLYECLTDARPFSGNSHYELMHAVLHAPVKPPSVHAAELPSGVDSVIARAMNRDAAARYEDVRALGRALLEFASAETRARYEVEFQAGDDTEVDERRSLREPARKKRRTWLLPLSATLVALLSTALSLHGRPAHTELHAAKRPVTAPTSSFAPVSKVIVPAPPVQASVSVRPEPSAKPTAAARVRPKPRRVSRPSPSAAATAKELGRDDVVDPFAAR